ncbi:hypothetical protein UB46_28480 [Burkholderiaceae bacterium 16]|nr:hypothetical protein UB46_28480 [Burkholderiaceae bacterium 16]
MTQSFAGKTIIIAGGSSGMGLALARKAVALGAIVHVIGRSQERLDAARLSIGDIVTHRADIGVEADVEALAVNIPHVDHLVCTAADLAFKPFAGTSNEDIERMLGGKFWGPIYLVRHLTKRLAKDGSVTFFSGAAAYKAIPGASIVAALNASLEGLARTLALELAPIRVNVISPGVVDSPVWDFLPGDARADTLGAIGAALPRGRVGTVDELADAGLFAISNGFMTGSVLQIDGGNNA